MLRTPAWTCSPYCHMRCRVSIAFDRIAPTPAETYKIALNYQSHEDDAKGMSDSFKNLARLHMPDDMTDKSFLDIGCNEGIFLQRCGQSWGKPGGGDRFCRKQPGFRAAALSKPED